MSSLPEKLQSLGPKIKEILSISGGVGASIGVLHKGRVYTENYGFRDHALAKAPDSDTLYGICSLTKSMVAFTVSSLVAEGKIQWNTPIIKIIPELSIKDHEDFKQATFIDLLSHRSGLPTANVMWYQGGSKSLMTKSDLLPMINSMTPKFPIRSGWSYTNWGYSLVAEAVARVTGVPWQTALKDRVFKPLGMQRSRTDASWREDENVADGFSGIANGKPLPILSQDVYDSSIMGPAGGVCSSVREMLAYYKNLMAVANRQSNAIIPEAEALFASHGIIYSTPVEEATYGLGLLRCRLPGKLGIMSDNSGLVEMPLIGEGTTPQVVFNHAGTLSGFYTCVYLLPESETCMVVFLNSKPVCDSADWIGQLVLQTVLDVPRPCDIVEFARKSVSAEESRYKDACSFLDNAKRPDTHSKPLQHYCGRYTWVFPGYYLDVKMDSETDNLHLQFIERSDQVYALQHYQDDTFTWLMTDEEEAKRGRFIQGLDTYKIVFTSEANGKIQGLTWPDVGGMSAKFTKAIQE